MSFCLYTVATGPYAKMAEGLVASLRDNDVQYDFLALSNRYVNGATGTIEIEPGSKSEAYSQKIHALRTLSSLGYDYLVFIDCDVLCLSPFSLDRFDGMPCFAILEDNLEMSSGTWHSMDVKSVVSLFLSKNPDMGRPIHNLNGGFFGVRAEYCEDFVSLYEQVTEFPQSMEPGLSFAVHSMADELAALDIRQNDDLILPVVANQLVVGDPKEVLATGKVEYMSPFSGWHTWTKPSLAHFCYAHGGKRLVMDYKPKRLTPEE